MFIEILVAVFAGIAIGTVTGVAPGVHINLVAALVFSSAAALAKVVPLFALACFIIALGITHTFLDAVPSIFLGAPDDEKALGVLPAHRFLLKGRGLDAIRLSAVGAFFGLLASVVLFVPFYYVTLFAYPFIAKYMVYFLIAIALYMILRDRKRVWAAFIFLASGVLGVVVFALEPLREPLLPLLSGLFGASTLLYSLNDTNNIPKQRRTSGIALERGKTIKAVVSGNCSSFLTSTFPGLSSSIAATMSVQVTRKLHDNGFLILLGAIGTAGFSLSLVALLAVEKARNGAVIVIQGLLGEVTVSHVLVFLAASLIAGGIAVVLTLLVARCFASIVARVAYRLLVFSVIAIILSVVFAMTGWLGLVVLCASTAMGLLPAVVKTTRTQAMGCLLLPVILYFL